ncbi:transcriptional regulator NrdR [Thermostilla marina]
MMKCPNCQADDDRVIDSRSVEDGYSIRRRRQCNCCNHRFTTYERVERTVVKVIKKDGSRVPFDRGKLKAGLEKACWKRPVTDNQIERIIRAIEQELAARPEPEIPSRTIGELAMEHLRRVDEVAFVRFASVYRQFKDVRDFVDEVKPILDEKHTDR